MTPTHTTLLRRTAAAFAAIISGAVVASAAVAQVPAGAVRLQTSTGTTTSTECTYGSMSVAPNGAITVTCNQAITVNGGTSTPPPPPPPPPPSTQTNGLTIGFSLSTTGGALTTGATGQVSVVRRGESAGAYQVPYTVTGDACTTTGLFEVGFGSGETAAKPITQVVFKSTGSSCVVTMQSGLREGTTVATFTRDTGTSTPPPTGVPAGCPALPSNAQNETFGVLSSHNKWKGDPTGNRVIIAAMPVLGASYSYMTMHWMNSPLVNTPADGTVRFSISRCPGQISTDYTNYCNQVNGVTIMDMVWATRPSTSYPDEAAAKRSGVCWAPESTGPWYMNIRYEFNGVCGASDTTCGMLWQYY